MERTSCLCTIPPGKRSHFWLFTLSLLDRADSPRAVELGEDNRSETKGIQQKLLQLTDGITKELLKFWRPEELTY